MIKMQTFWLKKINLKMASAEWRQFCLNHIPVIIFCISIEIILNATRYPEDYCKVSLQRRQVALGQQAIT